MKNGAAIAYVEDKLHLSELPVYEDVAEVTRKPHVEADTTLMPGTTTVVGLIGASVISSQLLVEQRTGALENNGLLTFLCVLALI